MFVVDGELYCLPTVLVFFFSSLLLSVLLCSFTSPPLQLNPPSKRRLLPTGLSTRHHPSSHSNKIAHHRLHQRLHHPPHLYETKELKTTYRDGEELEHRPLGIRTPTFQVDESISNNGEASVRLSSSLPADLPSIFNGSSSTRTFLSEGSSISNNNNSNIILYLNEK